MGDKEITLQNFYIFSSFFILELLFLLFFLYLGPFIIQFSSIQSLSSVELFATLWTAARQAYLSIANSWSLLRLTSIELVMPSSHLVLCPPLLLLPSVFARIRVFSDESVVHTRWPECWSFNFSISPSNEYSGLISFRMDWLDLLTQRALTPSPL